MRWPGGCFADRYHWKDGIGPKETRPSIVNYNWGDVKENNSFGTHEYMRLIELLDCDAFISGNMGSGTVREMAEWLEYLTSDSEGSPMTQLRKENGREQPWKVKFFGIGNESWGCGGLSYLFDFHILLSSRATGFGLPSKSIIDRFTGHG